MFFFFPVRIRHFTANMKIHSNYCTTKYYFCYKLSRDHRFPFSWKQEGRLVPLGYFVLSVTWDLAAPDAIVLNASRWAFLALCPWLRMPLIFSITLLSKNRKGILPEFLNSFNCIAMFIWWREVKWGIRYLGQDLDYLISILCSVKLISTLDGYSIVLKAWLLSRLGTPSLVL